MIYNKQVTDSWGKEMWDLFYILKIGDEFEVYVWKNMWDNFTDIERNNYIDYVCRVFNYKGENYEINEEIQETKEKN
jgi:hypothetical protein